MTVSMRLDAQEIDPRLVGHRQLGFGEPEATGTRTLEISVSKPIFIDSLADAYTSFVAETREETSDDPDDLLHANGYPSLREAIEAPGLLRYVVLECLTFQFLEVFAASSPADWWINSIEDVHLESDTIRVSCLACRARRASR